MQTRAGLDTAGRLQEAFLVPQNGGFGATSNVMVPGGQHPASGVCKLCLSVDEKVTQALQLLRGVGRLDLVVAGALPEMRPTHRASDCMQKRHV
ncbi:hypothetical protein NDU88_001412 [Pleurodeles waltl]|uniref:Uncharacterized protein n=1 Tax=Pleurodeles waltl TaxID=8319 RepID=A0AAV7SZ54_PLEWA|nr:hypothetical protein NDU88_001412 [Pleurodeles waltl]